MATEIKEIKGTVNGISWKFISPIPPCLLKDHFKMLQSQGLGPFPPSLRVCSSEAAGVEYPGSEPRPVGLRKAEAADREGTLQTCATRGAVDVRRVVLGQALLMVVG